ncbi:hypothetical protein HYT02_01690 [Candidatus Gottesmanbacteria bacterium]|nr:hypothetical protein [Candidatus Gottesmanbacteria bacterium]
MRHNPLRRRYSQDKKNMQFTAITIIAIIVLLILFIVGGIPALSSIGSFIGGFKKDNVNIANDETIVLEPILDPPVTATNTATISITGSSTSGSSVLLYVNGSKQDEVLVGKEGTFIFNKARLQSGDNEIYTISKINNLQSQPSSTFTVSYLNVPPQLEITKPQTNTTTRDKQLTIEGKTDKNTDITVNDRFVYTDPNGNFNINFTLSTGENNIIIKAIDIAGNTSQKELKIIYEE